LSRTDQLLPINENYTYRNANESAYSLIDHFLISNDLLQKVFKVNTQDSGCNLSDHCAIIMAINVIEELHIIDSTRPINDHNKFHWKLRWDKADLQAYQDLTYLLLNDVKKNNIIKKCYDSCTENAVDGIEQLYDFIVNAITDATASSIPRVKQNFFKHWWDTELSDAKLSSMQAYKDWIFFGKPKFGYPFSNMHKKSLNIRNFLKININ
jgi:hypothetical protein